MKKYLKKAIKRSLAAFGLDVRRALSVRTDEFKWLKDMDIQTVIDVGASKGNAVRDFMEIFPRASIYAFEPLRDCFDIMNEKLKNMPNVKTFNMALSDKRSRDVIHRSSYSGSSSLRKMADLHKQAFPVTAGERDEDIETDTMDNVLYPFELKDDILVKIDVQGLEDRVILGGQTTLARAKIVIIETSFVELYEGQPLFDDVYKLLTNSGFKYAGSLGSDFKSPLDGSSLQQDSVFIK